MKRAQEPVTLDELVSSARRAEPAPLSEFEAFRLARDAALRVERPTSTRTRSKPLVYSLLAAALCATFVLPWGTLAPSWAHTVVTVGASDRPLRFSLRSGDTVVAGPSTRLEIEAQEAARRVVVLERGAALFDVVPLARGQLFAVTTAHARVEVRGTVFSVEVVDGRTLVRVYEGRVRVNGKPLEAGLVWTSSGEAPHIADHAPLASEAQAQARLRGVDVRLSPHSSFSPAVKPLPVTEPLTKSGPPLEEHLTKKRSPEDAFALAIRALYREGDAHTALALLDAHDLDEDASLLRERASVLRVDALLRLERIEQARSVARRYVLREPENANTARMREIAGGLREEPR